MGLTKQSSGDLKARVNTCLNKLSDRDTLTIATNELESIARTLSTESFAPFLNCLSATDSSEKSPVRRQCVRLVGVLSAAHGDALSPHLSRMLSSILRRLRDTDSAVRAACVDAVTAITTHVTKPPFSSILSPLVDALFHEQDHNAQMGVALCLAAAVEAAPQTDTAELKKLLLKTVKLLKSDCFKAKPALLLLIGCMVSACAGSKSKSLLKSLVEISVEFSSSDDWATRKAAAEVLERLAMAEKDSVSEFVDCCVSTLESRRFDKVKVVRETMNRALEMWREIPAGLSDVESSPRDCISNEDSPVPVCKTPALTTPPKRTMLNRSPTSSSSSTSSTQMRTVKSEEAKTTNSRSNKMECRRNSRSRVVPFNGNDEDCAPLIADHNPSRETKREEIETSYKKKEEIRFSTISLSRMDSKRSSLSGEVPSVGKVDDVVNMDDGAGNNAGSQKEFEDLSLIRKQLLQIENQQSSLLDLLQKFIGNSQKGMSSLEKRVNGLERVLGEMSQDLSISTRRTPDADSTGNSCCMIAPEFLSPKFWKGQSSNSKFSSFKSQSPFHSPRKDA